MTALSTDASPTKALSKKPPAGKKGGAVKVRDADATRKKLLGAALQIFSTQGYDAASTRQIEMAAGVKRGLIGYHFGSKQDLWKSTADEMMKVAEAELVTALIAIERIDPVSRLRFFVRSYVIFCAKHPELNRLMIQEGMDRDWRLNWLLERGVRRWYEQVCRLFGESVALGLAPKMDAHHFYYIITGAATLMFSNAVEAESLSKQNPLDPAMVEAHAEALANLFVPGESR
ncbi:MAG: AcrR family transcriptional regulator [Dinoroseobacter sp.]|jgi:AcrR family transcriptional regulator